MLAVPASLPRRQKSSKDALALSRGQLERLVVKTIASASGLSPYLVFAISGGLIINRELIMTDMRALRYYCVK